MLRTPGVENCAAHAAAQLLHTVQLPYVSLVSARAPSGMNAYEFAFNLVQATVCCSTLEILLCTDRSDRFTSLHGPCKAAEVSKPKMYIAS